MSACQACKVYLHGKHARAPLHPPVTSTRPELTCPPGGTLHSTERCRAYQLCKLVVGFEAAQQAAELVVVGVLCQALLRPQDLPRPLDKVVQKSAPLCVADEQGPPHRRQPHLPSHTGLR